MVNELGLLYPGGMIALLFFWTYSIVPFLSDLKNKFIPKDKQYPRERRYLRGEKRRGEERREQEEQLY